jgi:hypothetical protein
LKAFYLIGLIFFSIIVLFTPNIIFAQSDKLGGWQIANMNYHLNSKIGLFAELQVRSQEYTNDFFYYEIKGGFSYYLKQKNSLMFGIGNYKTYSYPGNFEKPVLANEFRMWEQFVLNNDISRVKIEHRYRIEQRWINGNYFNRFRYRLNPVVPLNHNKIIPKTIFISVFDEVFFTDKPPYFIRNRAYAGAGYQFTKFFTLQTGFIRQFDYRISDNGTGKNFIQTSLLFNIYNTDSRHEVHPSPVD